MHRPYEGPTHTAGGLSTRWECVLTHESQPAYVTVWIACCELQVTVSLTLHTTPALLPPPPNRLSLVKCG